MILVSISDTHNFEIDLPAGDVLIHCGDATMSGESDEFVRFARWMGKQPHSYKLYVPGNHDFFAQKEPEATREELFSHGVRMLVDEKVVVNGVQFYGSPWVPHLVGWAFYKPSTGLKDRFSLIPDSTEVLITHGPAYGTLDKVDTGDHVGSSDLKRRIATLPNLKHHFFGHIHESYGIDDCGIYTAHNTSICNERYHPVNDPVVVEIS